MYNAELNYHNSESEYANNNLNSQSKLDAYARLDFNDSSFYLQTLQAVLGRRGSVGSTDNASRIDVDLGSFKDISRKHAEIIYKFDEMNFIINVWGINGITVNNTFYAKDENAILTNG